MRSGLIPKENMFELTLLDYISAFGIGAIFPFAVILMLWSGKE